MTHGSTLTAMMVLNAQWVEQLFVAPEHLREGKGSRLLLLAQSTRSDSSFGPLRPTRPHERSMEARFPGQRSGQQRQRGTGPSIRYRWTRPTAEP